jgi:hypothetical protein
MAHRIDDPVIAISLIEKHIRAAVQMGWMAQRADNRSMETAEALINRLVIRAIEDLREDTQEQLDVSDTLTDKLRYY